jgi:lycopene cyclase domain-containing protein
MSFAYLAALVISIVGMVVLDRRFRLFFWRDARRAAIVLAAGVAFFVFWDLAGIGLGVFFRGGGPWMTGLQVAPELPVEELGFLTLLCYLTMNAYAAAGMLLDKNRRRRVATADREHR